ncbi:chemotaxis protein CheW [Paenibacillus sp. GCM10027629]|uniref:chemotaxis protein CheW n=1 Tax=Paenibacillus sp. GCM10027629 TaxID=3273414 RepID=UPI0036447C3E
MSIPSHLSEYMSVFMDELDEQIQIMEEQLLKLEAQGGEVTIIQTLFRAAHTLKGSSAAMGFDALKNLTHGMENVFDLIRNRQLVVDSALTSVLFHATDYLKLLRHSLLEGQQDTVDIDPLLVLLEQITQQNSTESKLAYDPAVKAGDEGSSELVVELNRFQRNVAIQAMRNQHEVYSIYCRVRSDAVMKSVRALLVYQALQESSEVIAAFPPVTDIEDESKFLGEIILVVVTKESQQLLEERLSEISQIEVIHIESIHLNNLDQYVNEEDSSRNLSSDAQIGKSDASGTGDQPQVRRSQTVRVDVDRLEQLLNLVGELIIDNTRLHEVTSRMMQKQHREDSDLATLSDIANHFGLIIGDLQEGMMKTRMLPIEHLFNRFPRMVRDMAQATSKEIEFVMEGKETELDRKLIEEISDPLIHILRNAADHGIESPEERVSCSKPRAGKLLLKATHQDNQIMISVTDDGKGIDPIKVKSSAIRKGIITEHEAERMTENELQHLIFRSGLSTAEQVTDLSGRGVGMDIVRAHIEKLNGLIDIHSTVGTGTSITIRLPLTLAIIRALMVELDEHMYAIPLMNVVEIVALQPNEIKIAHGREVCYIRGNVYPFIRLDQKLRVASGTQVRTQARRTTVIIVSFGDKQVCIAVDRTLGNREIVMKSLGKYVGEVPYISGSTITGDGGIALVLDVHALVNEEGSKIMMTTSEQTLGMKNRAAEVTIFQLAEHHFGISVHDVREIIQVPDIESILHPSPFVQGMFSLRGEYLPLYDLHRFLGLQRHEFSSKARIIVMESSRGTVGILIDQVMEVTTLDEETRVEDIQGPRNASSGIVGVYSNKGQLVTRLHLEEMIKETMS